VTDSIRPLVKRISNPGGDRSLIGVESPERVAVEPYGVLVAHDEMHPDVLADAMGKKHRRTDAAAQDVETTGPREIV